MCPLDRLTDPSQFDLWPDVYERYFACRVPTVNIRAEPQVLE